jgi:hypothetical protein
MNEMSAVAFYRAVAELLGCEDHSDQIFPYGRRTRWNNRKPGAGRFPGYGLVRYHGPAMIHVHLTTPPVQGLFHSIDDVLAAIRQGC